MMTPVGLTARETAASVRAGTMRFTESTFYDKDLQRFTLAEVPDDGLPEVTDGTTRGVSSREARLLRLAMMPLRECVSSIAGRSVRVGLSLALPEAETRRPLDRAAFLSRLASLSGGAFDPRLSDASHSGRAGGLIAIGQGVATVRSGQSEFMIVGGADTYRDAYILGSLDLDGRVKTPLNGDGFVPGEGAAFLLLTTAQSAAAHGLATFAVTSSVATGFETGHLYSTEPYRGDGLAATIRQLVAMAAINAPLTDVYSSMNGESHWAKEWGVSAIRNRSAFHPDHAMHHPADSLGETGAASGPIMAGLAALGIRASYRRSPALVYASSDRGARAALVVTALPH
jgi:3-oxoacyl-[acyl-carrier-protein] synthase I